MKVWIKIAIGVLAGFAGGFASGFFVHKRLNDIQFEEVTEAEMDEIVEAVGTNDIHEETKIADETAKVEERVKNVDPSSPEELRKVLQGKTPYIQADKDQKRAYEKIWGAVKEYSNEENADQFPVTEDDIPEDDHPREEDFDEDFLEQIEEETAEAGSDFVDPPHLISLGEFYNERPEYDKVTIDWYQPDNTWIDEHEEVIADIFSYIGMETNGLFEEQTGDDDPDVRFVRNDKYHSDYEIVRHHRSWAETIGGIN